MVGEAAVRGAAQEPQCPARGNGGARSAASWTRQRGRGNGTVTEVRCCENGKTKSTKARGWKWTAREPEGPQGRLPPCECPASLSRAPSRSSDFGHGRWHKSEDRRFYDTVAPASVALLARRIEATEEDVNLAMEASE